MKNTLYAVSILACASFVPLAARAAEQSTPQAADTAAGSRAKVAAESEAVGAARAKGTAESAHSDMQRAKRDAESARSDEHHAKIDEETARRELEQMRGQMRDLSKRMAELSTKLGDVGPRTYAYRYFGDPARGLIGVVLGKNEHGLLVSAVTPGGPADKAGVKNGDVIVVANGVDVSKTGGANTPEVLRNIKVGEPVKITVLRDGKKIDATMKAERREPFNFSFAFNDQGDLAKLGQLKRLDELQELGDVLPPDFDKRIQKQVEMATREAQREAERAMERAEVQRDQSIRIAERANDRAHRAIEKISMSMPWWGLNLTNLNPDLGAYFGADHGVLVLSADADASKTLKSGDVLLSIGGKRVERSEDALRLLREEPGKDVKVEVLRQRKTQMLSMRAPEFKTMFVPAPPPVAPVAPTPPTPAPQAMPAPPMPTTTPTPHHEAAPPAPPTPPTPADDSEAPRAHAPGSSARIA